MVKPRKAKSRGGSTPSEPVILNVGYKSTNYWVVSVGTLRLLVDTAQGEREVHGHHAARQRRDLLRREPGVLAKIGIAGEILHTPGHSEDHVTLLLDNGAAFVGDLRPMSMTGEEGDRAAASWQMLIDKGANTAYPGHGATRRM